MSKPFAEATIQGIAFTFERHTCGEYCGHKGAAIGMTNLEKVFDTRIGVCRKYLKFSPEAWGAARQARIISSVLRAIGNRYLISNG